MKASFIDRYADLDSPLHQLDARTKLIGFTALIVAVLTIPSGDTFVFFAFFFLAAIFMGISQVPLGYILGRALVLLPFVVLANLARPWRGGMDFVFLNALVLRSLLSLIILVLLTNTTRFTELLHGLGKLGCPRAITLCLGFLYRYAFVLTDEWMRMRQARDCRSVGRVTGRTGLKARASKLANLIVRSFERAERLYQAMLSRGYSSDFPVYGLRRFSWRDLVFTTALAPFVCIAFRP
jgi:cobalt/nickel transport system permease protein